jgi:hypothetical protein
MRNEVAGLMTYKNAPFLMKNNESITMNKSNRKKPSIFQNPFLMEDFPLRNFCAERVSTKSDKTLANRLSSGVSPPHQK